MFWCPVANNSGKLDVRVISRCGLCVCEGLAGVGYVFGRVKGD